MFSNIKSFLLGPAEDAAPKFDNLQIAVMALLVRAATTDADFSDDERRTIRQIATDTFGLAPSDLDALVATAESEEARTIDLHRWAQAIKRGYDEAERLKLVEKMWEVVYADGVLDDYEANLLRRVAGLIYVPDRESGEARQRVRARLGLRDRPTRSP
ncbi:MAG: TerB family tellurite resistance protein [Parvibaculum sp.]|uniref:tellurite resistance TerB family protein n=1 Tax=Parvibaculum sp. TaxID=2024848 RepID=UPI0027246EBC|nr:TerB family tellurite resistance protein [Parvibaculum sp.]MDO8840664.1 TerB family tellurite resistance protein [Parvibaculum sp.]